MLGSTFNYVFEIQLENLQNADRFYYLERLDGLNLLAQLEGNSFAELITRNTTADGLAGRRVRAARLRVQRRQPAITGEASRMTIRRLPIVDDPATTDVDERPELARMPNGTIRYSGRRARHLERPQHGVGDRIISSEGDDTLRGNGGNDVMEGGAGNDQPHRRRRRRHPHRHVR